ncbi:MAG: PIN domain-containing protein [Acidobacteriia bacterium]|nr:PIN domain-containing protein [Terriglobia bacterium]
MSGLLKSHGPPGRILEFMVADVFVVLYDHRIVSEYLEVLARPAFGFHTFEVDRILEYIIRDGEQVTAGVLDVWLPDSTDLPFLEVAAAGQADALITGNIRDFKPTRGRHSVNVCSPADFLRQLP